jgi:hypothetical protein
MKGDEVKCEDILTPEKPEIHHKSLIFQSESRNEQILQRHHRKTAKNKSQNGAQRNDGELLRVGRSFRERLGAVL